MWESLKYMKHKQKEKEYGEMVTLSKEGENLWIDRKLTGTKELVYERDWKREERQNRWDQ